jgi:probable F420-dependent oxidoreductase
VSATGLDFGITTLLTSRSMSPARLAREVEDRGFTSLWLPEHSHIPASRATPFPGAAPGREELPDRYWHLNGQVASMAMAVATTERLLVGSAVTLVAQHDPIWLAKEVATIDHHSGGRLALGVGYGWNREEYEAHGHRWDRRRERTTDCIGIMRSLWNDDEASWDGAEASLAPSWSFPKSTRPGGPELLLGAAIGPRMLEGFGAWADGWMPIRTPALDLSTALPRLRAAIERAGRDPAGLGVTVMNAPRDPAALEALADELEGCAVRRAVFTVWPEDDDEILAALDDVHNVSETL